MAGFYSARSETIPPLPWPNFAPPFPAPEGYVKVHENHHLWSKTRVGRALADGQYEVVFETAELVEPDPFPEGYQ